MSLISKIGLSAEMETGWLVSYTRMFFVFGFHFTALRWLKVHYIANLSATHAID